MAIKIDKEKVYIVNGPAGTYLGKIVEKDGNTVEMKEAQLLYYWAGAHSLSQLATEGTTNPSSCKFSVECEVICEGVLRILPCTDVAVKSLRAVKIWKA